MSDRGDGDLELSAAKRALLEQRRRQRRAARERSTSRPSRRPGDGPFPLSFGQQRMWLLDQLHPGLTAYNAGRVLRLRGPLDVGALERALTGIAGRHAALRTTLGIEDDEPVQRIGPAFAISLEPSDVTAAPDPEAAARELIVEEVRRPFDLASGVLMRARLFRLDVQDHMLAIVMHHVASDEGSKLVLFDELGVRYNAARAGRAVELPEPALRYADYAAWEREQVDGGALTGNLQWWREQLADVAAELELPYDRSRPRAFGFTGARYQETLDPAVLAGLRAVAREQGATLFMVLLSAYKALLERYARQGDVVVAVPTSGRMAPEHKGIIGMFGNTVVLRTALEGDPTFRELVSRVRETVVNAFTHEVSFEQLTRELGSDRDQSHFPIAETMFNFFENPSAEAPALDGLEVTPVDIDPGVAKINLALSVSVRADGLRLLWEYSSELFDAATGARISGHLRTVLEAVAADPSIRLSRLPLITASELRTLDELNATATEIPSLPVHELVRARAREQPDAVAVRCGGRSLTYRELDLRANRLAHALIEAGAAPGVLVGLWLDRSVDLIVAIHGVLRAGAAYVPLDPDHPRERVELMLSTAQARLLVSRSDLRDHLDAGEAIVVSVDDPRLEQRPASAPESRAGLRDLAYVIFTSGSTGRPKGVMMEHRSLVNLLTDMAVHPGLRPGETMMGVTTPAFDLSVPDLYLPLICGGTLALARPEEAADPRALARLLAETEAVVVQATPSTWRMLLDDGWLPERPMRIVVGGEAVPVAVAERLAEVMEEVWDFYGPTETCVWSTRWRVAGGLGGTVPIGRPLANTACYVVDGDGNRTPVGVPGELWIGGAGVAPRISRGIRGRRRPVRCRPVRARRSGVPNRGPCAADPGGAARVRRPARSAGQVAGLPDRARRDLAFARAP